MKPSRFRLFVPCSRPRAIGMLLAAVGFSAAPAFAALDSNGGIASINTYNGNTGATGLNSAANWDKGAPFLSAGGGIGGHLLFTGTTDSTFTGGGGTNSMNAASFNVTNGSTYTLQVNATTSHEYRMGFTTSGLANTETIVPFNNPVSGVDQDLIYLSNGSDLTFNAANDSALGTDATMSLRQTGNFNVGIGSVLTVNTLIKHRASGIGLNIAGGGTTIFTGANTYSGTTTVRSGTLEISGTSAGIAYTVNNSVNNVGGNDPVLKLSNLSALPAGAKITGADSSSRDGIVDLAVAGAYIMSSYEKGNITFTTTSGSPTTLTFTDASKITTGANTTRTFNNGSADLSVLFDSTLDIGGDSAANVTINGAGNTTINGDILSTGAGERGLTKNGTGTLTLNGVSAYTGTTNVNAGKLVINGNISTSQLTTVSGTGTVSGSGTTGDLTVASGGTLSPGNSPGTLATGDEIWENGGDYNWQMLDATGVAGTAYDTIAVTGTLDLSSLTAGGFGINLWSLSSIAPDVNGDALNFKSALTQSWTILTTTLGIIGFDAADFTIATGINNNTGGFSNAFSGAFSLGQSGDSQNLILTYTAVPEPAVALLGGIGLLGLLRRRRNG